MADIYRSILAARFTLPICDCAVSPAAADLLSSLLVEDPSKRLCGAAAVMGHPFFRGFDWKERSLITPPLDSHVVAPAAPSMAVPSMPTPSPPEAPGRSRSIQPFQRRPRAAASTGSSQLGSGSSSVSGGERSTEGCGSAVSSVSGASLLSQASTHRSLGSGSEWPVVRCKVVE